MLIRELFEQLSIGEFKPMAVGGANESGILERDWPKVVPHINLALSALHTRFDMRIDSVSVDMYEHITDYRLDEAYALTNDASSEPHKYIHDTVYKPFLGRDTVIQITNVVKEDGSSAILNNPTEVYSMYTPSPNTLHVPYNDGNNSVTVEYRANHPKVVIAPDLLDQDIDISYTYLEPLLLFIAARLYSSRTNDQGNLGSMYMSKYELACRSIEQRGLLNKVKPTNIRLEQDGWV